MYKETKTKSVVFIDITPSYAHKLLTKNKENRRINKTRVKQYATSMARGEWVDNGQTIVISDNGLLIDGQHRLSAVVESGQTIKSILVTLEGTGLNPIGIPIDLGQSRNISNITGIPPKHASVVRNLMRMFETNGQMNAKDPARVEERYETFKLAFDAMKLPTVKFYSQASIVGIIVMRYLQGHDYSKEYKAICYQEYEKIRPVWGSWMRYINRTREQTPYEMNRILLASTYKVTSPEIQRKSQLYVNVDKHYKEANRLYQNIIGGLDG